MKINKRLFEDILAGKLEGTFVLRNKLRIKTKFLMKSNFKLLGFLYKLHDLDVICAEYTEYGKASNCAGSNFDIVDFIPDTDMKQNELTVEIPDGKEIDWDESKKQNKIVLKDKELTYEDICMKVMKDGYCYINSVGWIQPDSYNLGCANSNAAASEHQLECLLAKNKLANVAKYLNGEWKPDKNNSGYFDAWIIYVNPKGYMGCMKIQDSAHNSNALFKSPELAQQAIEILGEETVKLALEPLGI